MLKKLKSALLQLLSATGGQYVAKALVSLAAAAVCGMYVYIERGESGLRWFVISLLVIWR